jgi:HD-like signal output (HDOD) protein
MVTQSTELLDVRALEEAANGLAPLPAATSRLLGMATDPDTSLNAIVEIAQYDPGLTAALLRQANSAYARGTRQITDVRDAIVRLGLSTVVTIAMRSSIAAALDGPLDLYQMQSGGMYRHAVMSAVSAEVLRAQCPSRVPAMTPTVALLHDIGKLVIAQALGPRTVELVSALSTTDGQDVHESELAVFGLHHGHAGAYVIRHWKLPTSFLDGIVNHHGGQEDEPSFAALASQLADGIAHVIDAPTAEEEVTRTQELAPLCAAFGIAAETVPELIERTATRYDEVQSLIDG